MAPHANGDVEVTGVTDTVSTVIPDPVLTKNPTYARFTIDDVLPYRQTCAPMASGVAPFSSADMFKSKSCFTKPKARDFSYLFSRESAARKPSSLKGAMKYYNSSTISLCGGLPSSDYFPFENIGARIPRSPAFSEQETKVTGVNVTAGKHDVREGKSLFDLHIALNYGQSMGPPQLVRFLTEHTEIVHNPTYGDWDVALTIGSTSTLDIALRMFCERGDSVLTEEYSFSSAIESMPPMGLTPVGIALDDDGLLPESLDHILTTWDSTRGRKPRVLYTVPTGQNPTAACQPLQRRKQIYAIAEKHDLIILEDEPYYFLQMEPYISGVIHEVPSPFVPRACADFLSSLIPSYLSLDTSGRVIRMDSLSKTIAPGSRVGWVVATKQICERFVRHQEVSTQSPSGFSTAILYKLLDEEWGHRGFLEWLMFIRAEYTRRRDIICNASETYLPRDIARWKTPAAGMFHWIKVDAMKHPDVKSGKVNAEDLEEKVFLAAVQANVLVAKGSWFRSEKDNHTTIGAAGSPADLFFRMTFAAASEDDIVEAVKRFGIALKTEFSVPQ